MHKPTVDIRKPFTEIGTDDCYSGRTYDERYLQAFITEHNLPLNRTTAFLTPAFRTFNQPLLAETKLSGKPAALYTSLISLLQDIQNGEHSAEDYLKEILRLLIQIRDAQQQAIQERLRRLESAHQELSMQQIMEIVSAHMKKPRSSRLPVLVIAAAYDTAKESLGKHYTRLLPHTAADKPTDALGDLEIELSAHERTYIVYEVKDRVITQSDIQNALLKLSERTELPAEYAFVSTKPIPPTVYDYIQSINRQQLAVEIQAYDCLQFLKHFLHLFHEKRMQFLDRYKELVLSEPASAVAQSLKEKLLELIEEGLKRVSSAE